MFRLIRCVNNQITEFYRYFHVIFGTAAYQPAQPSDHTVQTVRLLFRLLRVRRHITQPEEKQYGWDGAGEEDAEDWDEPALWVQVRSMLGDCTDLDSLLHVGNDQGFNVLLVAVLQHDSEVLQLLLDEGVNVNKSHCTTPLHLACKLGDLQMVQLLLASGAAREREAGMCYPHPHTPVVHVPSRFHFLEADIFTCDSNYQLPIMYAVEGDHIDVVRYIYSFCFTNCQNHCPI